MSFFVSNILPVFYFVIVAWLLHRNRYLRNNGINAKSILLFFAAKCAAGFLYNFVALNFTPNGGDIWPWFWDGYDLYKKLLNNPSDFAAQLKQMFVIEDVDLTNTQSGFIRSVFEGIKLFQCFLNLFSFGNLYTNTILFNGLSSFVFLRCWIFIRQYSNSWTPGGLLFLFPSSFYFSSGIHKEGIVFVILACLLPLFYRVMQKANVAKLTGLVLLFALLFFFKFFVAILFAGAMMLWLLLEKFPFHKKKLFVLSLLIATGIFLLPPIGGSFFSLQPHLVNRQQEFLAMQANSRIEIKVLEPDFNSFLKALPAALGHTLFRPFPGEGGKMLYMAFSIEIIILWLLICWLIIGSKMRFYRLHSLAVAMLVFSYTNLVIIGYTIPNIGAMVRYRSIFLPWLLVFCWFTFNGDKQLLAFKILLQRFISK
ncbi:MAG: hypothetical protein V4717_07355 [Bacteroidota bacterium]